MGSSVDAKPRVVGKKKNATVRSQRQKLGNPPSKVPATSLVHVTLVGPKTKKNLRTPTLKLKRSDESARPGLRTTVTAKQVKRFQTVVDVLQKTSPKHLIVFRGQERLTKKVEAKVLRELSMNASVKEYLGAVSKAEKDAATFIAKVASSKYPRKSELRFAEHLKVTSGAEMLAIRNQSTLSGRYFVSTTRDLSVAFGNFYMAPTIRYVYILQVPKEHVLNVHSLVADKAKTMNLPTQGNQTEKELAIPLRATEFVRAIYDIKLDTMTVL